MLRMQRNAMDRMSMSDITTVTPSQLINARPGSGGRCEFPASSQPSQLLDEVNPLLNSLLRRLSSMGPGGLLVSVLTMSVTRTQPTMVVSVQLRRQRVPTSVMLTATYARINEAALLRDAISARLNGRATDEIVYLDASRGFQR